MQLSIRWDWRIVFRFVGTHTGLGLFLLVGKIGPDPGSQYSFQTKWSKMELEKECCEFLYPCRVLTESTSTFVYSGYAYLVGCVYANIESIVGWDCPSSGFEVNIVGSIDHKFGSGRLQSEKYNYYNLTHTYKIHFHIHVWPTID